MTYQNEVAQERPLSERDQIKSRNGAVYTQEQPLRKLIGNVNGSGDTKTLCLFKHPEISGALVMWYEDVV